MRFLLLLFSSIFGRECLDGEMGYHGTKHRVLSVSHHFQFFDMYVVFKKNRHKFWRKFTKSFQKPKNFWPN